MSAPEPTDLDELERLEAAATPGPWEVEGFGWTDTETGDGEDWVTIRQAGSTNAIMDSLIHDQNQDQVERNFALIAAARNALPDLIRRVREAEAERDRLRAQVVKVVAGWRKSAAEDRDAESRTLRSVCDYLEAVLAGEGS